MAQRKVLLIDAGHQAFDELDAADIPGGAGSPTDADYLVGTANAGLSAEIVVGTTPGGELGGTWGSPTVDATHSGSTHAATQSAAEATAASALSTHEADTTSIHGITNTANLYAAGGTDVAVADGGTGSSTAANARTALGLVIGTDVAAQSVTKRIAVPLDTPDASGNGYPALSTNNGFSNVRRVVPAFTKLVDGTWEGAVRIPADYASAGAIVCSFVANATSGAVRSQVSTAVAAVSVTEDTAYTAETATNTTVPGTAKQRFDITTTLTTTPVANSTLNVKIARIGTNGGDTLAVDALLWECLFQYTT